ncbi:protein DENND6B isoform X2 [Cervus elaphus]|uniref:protein DENND6B isoform X2 n=1 Tax=Cervus elaphus TaxID=9860 RepID=UPI001CC2F4C3|nr:protein DENND6B isoform X2 [Cervus elaphus]
MDQGAGAGQQRARGRLGAPSSGTRAPGTPWARFSAWLECVCVVTFDLELGQALEKSSICYLSFPDSHSGCLGDTQFSFRIRQCGGQRRPGHVGEKCGDSWAPASLQREPAHFFGYVYFRQVKDSSMKRGYFQKSLVLLSRLPFVRLFQALLGLVAPEFFDKLAPCLEAVCNEIDQWPAPAPGQTLNLPIMGVVLQVHIPLRADTPEPGPPKQSSHETLLPAPVVLPSVHELDLFRCFRPVLAHVQLLWELMLLGEPLLVLAPSPAVSSEMVLALTSCLQPLKFCCDYRPYFTIHDSEFKEFTTRTQAPPNVVLGVTNPFFIKTLQHWPHILRVGEPKMSGDLPKQVKLKKPSKLKTLDTKPGLYTAYTAHLHRDKALLRRLLKGLQKKRPSDVQTAVLRRHLLELTQSFIVPLVRPARGGGRGVGAGSGPDSLPSHPQEHYMASLMPLQKGIVPWKTPPQIRPFRQDDFLHSLERAGPQLTCVLKGDWLGLYRRFFKSPHFDGWYRQRHREMTQKLEALHLEAICEAVRGGWGGGSWRGGHGQNWGDLGDRQPVVRTEHRDLDEGQVRGGGRGSDPETSGETGSGTGPPAAREGGNTDAGTAVHRHGHRLPAQGPAGRPVPSLGRCPWAVARVWPSCCPPPPSPTSSLLPATWHRCHPAVKMASGTAAWTLTVGGSCAHPTLGPTCPL